MSNKRVDWNNPPPDLMVDWEGPSMRDLQAGALADLLDRHGNPESSSTENNTRERQTLAEFLSVFGRT